MGVAVLVLGHLARSPRMQYHALALAQAGFEVDLIGHGDHALPTFLDLPNLNIHSLPALPPLPRYFFILFAPFKIFLQLFFLCWILFLRIKRPSHILVQNPPSLPTLIVAQWVCYLRGSKLIIDWHNLGYTILALKFGESSTYVKLAKWMEWYYGRKAQAHFCVTKAMQKFLVDTFNVCGPTAVLYDRPQEDFRKLTGKEKQKLLHDRLQDQFPDLRKFRIERDILIITSTSWTADEDFDLLLDAICLLQDRLDEVPTMQIFILITGKGPLRAFYERAIAQMKLDRIFVLTGWLRAEDYPSIIGAADLGISLHTSSSNLDLPMKVVDMFGCGVPVCAKNFTCINELVTDAFGKTFKTSEELVSQILALIQDRELLNGYSLRIQDFFKNRRWQKEWNAIALPFFQDK